MQPSRRWQNVTRSAAGSTIFVKDRLEPTTAPMRRSRSLKRELASLSQHPRIGHAILAEDNDAEPVFKHKMDRVPLFVFAAVVAVIGVLAASSVYVTERNDARMNVQTAPVGQHR